MRRIFILALLFAFLAGCGKAATDPHKAYRGRTAEQLFQGAEASLASKNYTTASQQLEAMDAMYPFGPYAEQGQLNLIYAYYKKGDEDLTYVAAERYIRLYPRGNHVDYAYYMKGLVSDGRGMTWLQRKFGRDPAPRDLNNLKLSYSAFSQLVTLFPKSPYAADALRRMNMTRNTIARHYVLIADFYLKRKAYVAAANRASFVVEHFNGSPEVIPALAIMVKSYRQLGLTRMAEKSYNLLKASYPDSREARELSRG